MKTNGDKKHKVLNFIKRECHFPAKAGRSFYKKKVGELLLPFQTEIITEIFNPDGSIKTPNCFLFGARKVSKSLLFAWIIYYLLNSEKTGYVVPIVASNFSQGFFIFDFVKEQVLLNGKRKSAFTVRKDYILQKENLNKCQIVYNSPEANFGEQASCGVFDEIANHKDGRNMEAVETSMSFAEDKPLCLYASNQPENSDHFVLDLLRQAEKDKDFFVKKFVSDPKEDWTSPELWARVNPFIKAYMEGNKKFENVFNNYKKKCEIAKENKEKEISFRRLLCGQCVSADALEWVDVARIKIADKSIIRKPGIRYAVGIDLSAVRDATAVSHVFRDNEENIYLKVFIYYPNLDTRRKVEKQRFLKWEKMGFLKIQRKPVTDKEQIVGDFHDFIAEHGIRPGSVVFDPALASHWFESFKGFNPQKVHYSGRQMTGAIRELERAGRAGKLYFIGENDCLKWHFANAVCSQKSKGFVLLNRVSVLSSIDGSVASCLGLKYLLETKKKESLILVG